MKILFSLRATAIATDDDPALQGHPSLHGGGSGWPLLAADVSVPHYKERRRLQSLYDRESITAQQFQDEFGPQEQAMEKILKPLVSQCKPIRWELISDKCTEVLSGMVTTETLEYDPAQILRDAKYRRTNSQQFKAYADLLRCHIAPSKDSAWDELILSP